LHCRHGCIPPLHRRLGPAFRVGAELTHFRWAQRKSIHRRSRQIREKGTGGWGETFPDGQAQLDASFERIEPMSAAIIRSAQAVQPAGRLLCSLFASGLIALSAVPAMAHDAKPTAAKPLGWSYPFACCANYDCRTASSSEVLERPEGYVIAGTGEVVPMTDRRVKESPDGEYHWCAHQAGIDAGKTICLFVPPRSF
jgi:hypothetical protein